MASARYTRLATKDNEERMTFDYSSAFTFEEQGKQIDGKKYKSVFTYGFKDDVQSSEVENKNFEVKQGSTDRFTWLLVYLGYMVVYLMTFPILIWFSFKRVKEGERLVVFRLGHMQKSKGPGLALIFPFLDRYFKKDVGLRAFSVPPKQVITGDKAIIEVGAEIYFQIVDVEKSVTNVQDLDRSTRVLLQTGLCNLLSQKDLADIESERRAVADSLMEKSNLTCCTWGVQITRAELSQIKVLSKPLPKQTPSIMMPPGMFGSGGGGDDKGGFASGLPSIFAQLASSLSNSRGPDQTEAIAQALQAMVVPHVTEAVDQGSLPSNTAAADMDTEASEKSTITSTPDQVRQPGIPVEEPEQLLSLIRSVLCHDLVAAVQETYQVEITGSGEATYFLDLRQGEGSITEGVDPTGDPSATLTLTFEDLQAMLVGQLKPYQAYMSGRLRVAGDTAAALKLDQLGHRIQACLAHTVM